MEKHSMTAMNHFYKEDQCSGVFVYTVDDCKPAYIKFSTKIRIEVIFDTKSNRSSDNFGHSTTNESECDIESQKISEEQHDEQFQVGVEKSSHNKTTFPLLRNSFSHVSEDVGKEKLSNFVASSRLTARPEKVGGDVNYCIDSNDDMCADNEESEIVHKENDDPDLSLKEETSNAEQFLIENSSEKIVEKQDIIHKGAETKHIVNSLKGHKSVSDISKTKTKTEDPVKKNMTVPNRKKKTGNHLNATSLQKDETVLPYKTRHRKTHQDGPTRKEKKSKTSISGGLKLDLNSNTDNNVDNQEKEAVRKNESKCKGKKVIKSTLEEKTVDCCYCNQTFKSKNDFFNHRRTRGGSFQCKICGKQKAFEAFLMVHLLSHEPEKGCLDSEERNGSKNRQRYKTKCSVCGVTVSSIDSLRYHMMLHTGEYPYQCCVCEDHKFFSLASLSHHQQTHTVSKRFQCKKCDLRFSTRSELSKHKRTHEVQCGLCGEVFPNKTSRTMHYKLSHLHDIKKCSECYMLFSTEEEFEAHLSYHRNRKSEQCPECGIVVTRLKDHMLLHAKNVREKKFSCDQCPQRYHRKGALDKHLLVHSGERPYACNVCPKRFASQGILRKHLYTHAPVSERPYVCEICGKQFSVRSNMLTHKRIHSDRKKYPCPKCLNAFNYKISLDSHMKAKHGPEETVTTAIHQAQSSLNQNSITNGLSLSTTADLAAMKNESAKREMSLSMLLRAGQQQSYDTSEPSTVHPFLHPEQSFPSENNNVGPHISFPSSSEHTILDLDKTPSFDTPTNFNIIQSSNLQPVNALPSLNRDSFERTEMMSYQTDRTFSGSNQHFSLLSAFPPSFHLAPTSYMEQLSHSINIGNVPIVSTDKKSGPESENLNGFNNA